MYVKRYLLICERQMWWQLDLLVFGEASPVPTTSQFWEYHDLEITVNWLVV